MTAESDLKPRPTPPDWTRALEDAIAAAVPDAQGVGGLSRMLGGASKEVWRFDVQTRGGALPMVLRRAPGGREIEAGLSLADEAEVIRRMGAAGVAVPRVHMVSPEDSPLGAAFAMDRLEGVGDPVAIAHAPELEQARDGLAFQVGAACARMQQVALESLPALAPAMSVESLLEQYQRSGPTPVLELAFKWLADNRPPEHAPVIAHGDFRNSNLIVNQDGLVGIIDWEFAHPGDPLEDLAFLCLAPWRFGRLDRAAGGFGTREALFDGYASVTGVAVDEARFRYCQVLHMTRWCDGTRWQLQTYRGGEDPSLERGMVGRRQSEAELDLLNLLEGIDDAP